ncbi:1,6-anhydro-N-acetylmuramyl-L-alanine amidase AmpD [Rhodoferax sp.]|jgi:AmpD protein|uniref:1,6-anhydro-N-acetylmuramyl-L-alanine amidase AmpD n=1 Tax=Rhodoferax sp. TaxID=50421 RepID=UPI003783D934
MPTWVQVMTRVTEANVPHAPLWDAGWYRPAQHHPSPNFGPRPNSTAVDLVVLHSISLPPGVYGGNAVHQLFSNQLDATAHPYYAQLVGLQVSAHFFIQRDGSLSQFVSCDDRAWHAGRSSHQGRENCNDFSVGIELEGLEGDPFESAQYRCLLTLLPALALRYPIAAIAGHEHIAPGRKADPGAGLQWQWLQAHLGWAPRCFPEGVLT